MKSRYSASSVASIGMYAGAGYLSWRALPFASNIVTMTVRAPFNILCNLVTPTSFEASDFVFDSSVAIIAAASILFIGANKLSEKCQNQLEENAPEVAKLR